MFYEFIKKLFDLSDASFELHRKFELPGVKLKDGVRKDFAECSELTKKIRGEQLRQEKTSEEIELAFISNLSQTDQIGVQIVKSLSSTNSETKQQVLELLRGNFKFEIPYTPNEALALFLDQKSTRQKYELLRSQAKSKNSDLYPPYYQVISKVYKHLR